MLRRWERRNLTVSPSALLGVDFTKDPRGQGLTEGPSSLGFRGFKKR